MKKYLIDSFKNLNKNTFPEKSEPHIISSSDVDFIFTMQSPFEILPKGIIKRQKQNGFNLW